MDYTGQFVQPYKDAPHYTLELSITQALKVDQLRALGEGNL
jgi:hypothetical protein